MFNLPKLELSLNTYAGSTVCYRTEDDSPENLKSKFISISQKSSMNIIEALSTNNVIQGEIIKPVLNTNL